MAKRRYYKPITNKAIKQLNAIGDNVGKQIAVSLKDIAYGAQEVAQERLESTYGATTQSITPQQATKYIGVAIEGNVPKGKTRKQYKATIYAPTNKKYSNAMVFLEYGAGLGTKNKKPVINDNGADVWGYPIDEKQFNRGRELYSTGFVMQLFRGDKELLSPAVYKTKMDGEEMYMGITNRSQRIGYMKHARIWILQNARAKTIKNINMAMRRVYYKHMTPEGGEEE